MASPVDQTLADFEVCRVLGEGGSGTVYEARHGTRRVALKVLRQELSLSTRDAQRFVEEANRMGQVDHPGLVKLDSAGVLPDGRPYIAMQLLDGETLAARLARGPLPPEDAVRAFGRLARSVAALHAAGFIHRDIKPENIVIVGRVGELVPVLLDFGIAREITSGPSTTTASGAIRGTPAYMAPERLFGGPATVRSDIYELALTLHMMLVGKLPWPLVDGVAERLAPPSPAEFGAAVPLDLARSVLRALSTRPEVRPGSADAFAEEIERAWEARNSPAPLGAVTEDLVARSPASSASSDPGELAGHDANGIVRSLSLRPSDLASGLGGVSTSPEGNRALGRLVTVALVGILAGAVMMGARAVRPGAPASQPPSVAESTHTPLEPAAMETAPTETSAPTAAVASAGAPSPSSRATTTTRASIKKPIAVVDRAGAPLPADSSSETKSPPAPSSASASAPRDPASDPFLEDRR